MCTFYQQNTNRIKRLNFTEQIVKSVIHLYFVFIIIASYINRHINFIMNTHCVKLMRFMRLLMHELRAIFGAALWCHVNSTSNSSTTLTTD